MFKGDLCLRALFFAIVDLGACQVSVDGVLVVSSRMRVHALLAQVVRLRKCSIYRTNSYETTLGRLRLRGPSMILYSIFLPSKGKMSLILTVGGTTPGIRIVLLATRNGVPSKIRTVGGNTFSCVAGKSSGGGVVPLVDHTMRGTHVGIQLRGLRGGIKRACSFSSVLKRSGILGSTISLTRGISKASIPMLLAKRANANGRMFTRTVRCDDGHTQRGFMTIGYSSFDGRLLRDRVFNRGTNSFANTLGSGGKLFRRTGGKAVFLSRVNRVTFRLRTGLLHVLRANRCVGVNSAGPAHIGIHVVTTAGHGLSRRVITKHFHRSLFCELDMFRVRLPPLHRHTNSVQLLTGTFVGDFTRRLTHPIIRVTPTFLRTLSSRP